MEETSMGGSDHPAEVERKYPTTRAYHEMDAARLRVDAAFDRAMAIRRPWESAEPLLALERAAREVGYLTRCWEESLEHTPDAEHSVMDDGYEICDTCAGSGMPASGPPDAGSCKRCGGLGEIPTDGCDTDDDDDYEEEKWIWSR